MRSKSINIKGLTLFQHQKDVVDELRNAEGTGKVVCVLSSRQKGKSILVSQMLLFFAIGQGRQNKRVFYLAPTLKQAKPLYKMIVDGLATSGVIKAKNATDLIIEFLNGSLIYFKSAEQGETALRGYTADFLALDEASFLPSEIFAVTKPWTDVRKAPILMTSTPFVKNGFFWEYYNYGLLREHNTVTIDWSDEKYRESTSKLLSDEQLEEYRKILPANTFKTDYLGQFLDDDGIVFTGVQECLKQAFISQTDRLFVGIDWGNQQGDGDDTALSVFNDRGGQVLLRYWNNLSPLGQIDTIYKELEPYLPQIAVIACETNSLGTPYTDLLKEKSQIIAQKVQGVTTTNQSKNAWVTNLQVALEQKQITLLPDAKQKQELSVYTATYNPKTRNITYNAPNGMNDDICIAVMLSYDAFRNQQHTGHYAIRFAGNNNFKRR